MGQIIITKQHEILRLRLCSKLNIEGTNKFLLPKDKNDSTLLDKYKYQRLKITIGDSELTRMLQKLNPENLKTDGSELCFIRDLVELYIGNHTSAYTKNIAAKDGLIYIDDKPYIRLLCSAGDARSRKAFFCSLEQAQKVNTIALCGMNPENEFPPTKTNAYFGMLHSSTVPLSTVPNIVVVDDYVTKVHGVFNVVHGNVKNANYRVEHDVERDIAILPFDGGGIVSLEAAKKWSKERKLSYVPGAWQFRAMPGLKGVLFTFDVEDFIDEYGSSTITDLWGRAWDFRKEKIDAILTKSQFKFWSQYSSMEEWKTAFNTELYGYHRTFNISEVSEAPSKLKHKQRMAYQHLQTLELTSQEIKELAKPQIDQVIRLHTDVGEFLKYRQIQEYDDDTGKKNKDWNRVPPFYKALASNPSLVNDPFIRSRYMEDLRSIKNHTRVGKLIVSGNYQILCPDIFGFAQFAFGLPVTGLLGPNQIYSQYWNKRGKTEVDLLRNPHIAHEHCLVSVANTREMQQWFKHQNATIVTGMKDCIALRINSADFDGDTVLTTCNPTILRAVKRAHANTIYFEEEKTPQIVTDRVEIIDNVPRYYQVKVLNGEEVIIGYVNKQMLSIDEYSTWGVVLKDIKVLNAPKATSDVICLINLIKKSTKCPIGSIRGLMEADRASMQCKIGTIINPISTLWSLPQTQQIVDYITIMSVIGSLAIDAAKTGDAVKVPTEITRFLNDYDKPYFMRYRDKTKNRKNDDIAQYTGMQKSTMNLVCWHIERNINKLVPKIGDGKFKFASLLSKDRSTVSPVYYKVKQELIRLQKIFNQISQSKNPYEDSDFNLPQYDSFFYHCKVLLLNICDDVDRLLDILITIYYTDELFIAEYHNMSILWNSFSDEMIKRAQGNYQVGKVSKQAWQRKKEKSEQSIQKRKEYAELHTKLFDAVVTEQNINDIKQTTDNIDAQRLSLLIYVMCGEQVSPLEIKPKGRQNNSIAKLSKFAGVDRRKWDELCSILESKKIISKDETDNTSTIVTCLIKDAQRSNGRAHIKTLSDFNHLLEQHFQKKKKYDVVIE